MAQPDVVEQLRSLLASELNPGADRRVVFWHDADESFEEEFASMSEEALKGARPLHLADAGKGSMFALKKLLYRDYPGDDFLIYTKERKDLSARGLEGNWLADVEIVADHFQADFASMLATEVGASGEAVDAVSMFRSFFGAQDRRARFARLVPHAQTKLDVVMGVMASILGCASLSTEELVRTYLVSLLGGKDPLGSLARFGADGAWRSFLGKRTGYAGDPGCIGDLAAHILVTALSFQLPDGALDGLEDRVSPQHGQFCLNIVHDWMDDQATSGELFELCRLVESSCNLEMRFRQCDSGALADADIFPCINERIVSELAQSMAGGSFRADEARSVLQRRRDLHWHTRIEPYLDAIEAAADAQAFQRDHAQGFHLATPKEVWSAYSDRKDGWWRMDAAYRRFCRAVDEAKLSSFDIPGHVDSSLEELAGWMERVYVNWFLTDSNDCWVNASEKDWAETGYAEGIARQGRFYEESVMSGAMGAKKTLVIISDALRYEVAAELADRLEADTRGSTELCAMQGVFPTVTEFGMAALLPHSSMSFSMSDGGVYLNGGMPTVSCAQRQEALRARSPKGRCIQSKDLFSAKRSDRKELLGDADVVFVYHNKIDSIGEDYSTEHDVFDACETAIRDILSLVRIATGDLSFTRVLITADHGFLYTREPLEESGKVSGKDISGSTVRLGRRYAVNDEWVDDPLFVKMNMDDVGGGSYTGLSPRSCVRIKKAGPGENYVHGGVSLQEMCVPVIHFRNRRAGAKGYEEARTAGFKILSTARRVTSMMFRVDLFQKDRVEGKVLPGEYEVYMADASGNEVSDVRKAHANMSNPDETARVCRLQLSLKAGRRYDPSKPFFLICRNKATGEQWQEEYQIDIPFVPLDDFGF